MSEDNWTFALRDKLHMLNHRQTIATFQRNISQQHWLLDPACCARLASCCYMLRPAGCCWLKFENGQIFHATFVDVAWCCSRLSRFVQQCCARACALVRLSTRNRVAKRMSKNPTTDRVHGLPYGRVHGLPLQSRQGYSIRQPVSGIFILLLLLSCFGGGL